MHQRGCCLSRFMSMKSITTSPARSRRRSCRAASSAASMLVLKAMSSTPVAGGLAGVHIDGHQRFGLVDGQGAAGSQGHLAAVDPVDLLLGLEPGEQRLLADVVLEHVLELRHGALEEALGGVVGLQVVDVHFLDVGGEGVPQGPGHHVILLPDQAGAGAGACSGCCTSL